MQTDKKHFIHILTYSWENGGTSKVVFDLATYQINNGHDVTIYSQLKPGHKPYLEIPNVKIIEIDNPFLAKLIPLFSFDLIKLFSKTNFENYIIQLHGLWNFTLMAAWFFNAHKHSVITTHGSAHPYTFIGKKYKRLIYSLLFQKKLLKNVKLIHVLGESEKKEIIDYLGTDPGNIFICPNGISIPEVKDNVVKKPQILFLSRLHHKKGLDLLLPAFKEISSKLPHLKLIIAGPDEGMLDFVSTFIKQNDLNDKIEILGSVNGETKINLLLESEIFVLPSYSEGFSIAVLEALAYGLPMVISTETGLSNEIKQNNAGLICKLNIESLSATMYELLQDENLKHQFKKNGLKLLNENFNVNLVCEKLVNRILKKI